MAADAPSGSPVAGRWTYSLSSLLLLVTLAAVACGLFTVEPGLGIGFAILITPPLLRTTVVAVRRRKSGRAMSVVEKALAFLGSLALLVGLGTAISVSVLINCVVGWATSDTLFPSLRFWGSYHIGAGTGIVLGLLVLLGVGVARTVWIARRRKARRRPLSAVEIVRVLAVSVLLVALAQLAAIGAYSLLGYFVGYWIDRIGGHTVLLAFVVGTAGPAAAGVFVGLMFWLWKWKVD